MRRAPVWFLTVTSLMLLVGTTASGAAAQRLPGSSTGDSDLAQAATHERALVALLPDLHSRLGASFGGAWFDGSGSLVVGVVGATPVGSHAPSGVRFQPVTQPASVAPALRDRVTADVMSGALDGLGVVTVDLRPQEQAVVVGVTGDAAVAGAALASRYGDGIRAEHTGAPLLADRTSDQTLKSGLEITSSSQNGSSIGCTTAFGTHVGRQRFVATAGHCQETSASAQWRIGLPPPLNSTPNPYFGSSTRKTFADGSTADSLVITAPSAKAGPTDCVFESDAACRLVAGFAATLVVGQTVCKSGSTTGVSCGRLLTADTTVFYQSDGVHIAHIAAACGRVNSGDSGAGVYEQLTSGSAVAIGIVSGATDDPICPAVPLPNLNSDSNVMFFTPWRSAVNHNVGFPLRSGYREPTATNTGPCPDVLAVTQGYLYDYPGDCNGNFAAGGTLAGSGWDAFAQILRPGDFDGDGCSDLIGRTPDGQLLFYKGDCKGGFVNGVGKLIGSGWNAFDSVLAVGDFSGDGCPDLIGRTIDGQLLLYEGNCQGGFVNGQGIVVGSGFDAFDMLIPVGDWSGNGCADLLARFPDGRLRPYFGDCNGRFAGSGSDNIGWQVFDTIIGIGDFSGDGCPDLLARFPSGSLRQYLGDCNGGFQGGFDFNVGWQYFSSVQ